MKFSRQRLESRMKKKDQKRSLKTSEGALKGSKVSGASEVPQSRGNFFFRKPSCCDFAQKSILIDLDWIPKYTRYLVRRNDFFKKAITRRHKLVLCS